MLSTSHRWAVVLAGGDGSRLHGLTQLISGDPRPKQFCNLFGGKSLVSHTRERISPLFKEEQTLFALSRAHEPYYLRELPDVSPWRRIVQPANRGTALAIAVCLQAIMREDDEAVVAFFPSDHHYRNPAAFEASVDVGLAAAEECPHSALILGAKPTYAKVEYGWIQPGRTLVDSFQNPLNRVLQFWEKPSLRQAGELKAQGCLWNTFVMIGLASAFLELFLATVPQIVKLFEFGGVRRRLDEIYEVVPSLDFSKAVLSRLPRRLLVLQDSMSGWTDLGSPRRVIEVLKNDSFPPAWFSKAQDAQNGGQLC